MAADRSRSGGGMLGIVWALTGTVILLVIEVIAAMLVYIGLAIYSQSFFGYLVSLSRDFLNLLTDQLVYFFPDQANTAFATLLGELGPKSILLLLLGLTVGAIIRLVLWMIAGLYRTLAG